MLAENYMTLGVPGDCSIQSSPNMKTFLNVVNELVNGLQDGSVILSYANYLGKTRWEIIALLGMPDKISTPTRKYKIPLVYKYGKITFTFGVYRDSGVVLIVDSETHTILSSA
jgi:hypothetical protein